MRFDIEAIFSIVISSFMSFLSVRWAYFKILKIAKEKNLVDKPDARKLQQVPIPVLGGIAVFIGVATGLLTGAALHTMIGDPTTTRLLPVLCAMIIMLYVGAMDDIVGTSPTTRMIIEILTILGMIYATDGCIDTFRNLFGINNFSWNIGVPLTILSGVGIINAINMIDGVNGLSSGLCMVCSIFFGISFLWVGDTPNAVLAFSMAAALFPFLMHNVFGKKSRMFIGDAGTMVMGILMTWFVINMLRSDSPLQYYTTTSGVSMIALALAIMSVPVFDTLRVMTMRIARGKNPLKADKTHLHHVFIKAGISHAVTALTEILIDIIIVGCWALSVYAHNGLDFQLYIVVGSSMILVWGTYIFLHYNETRHTSTMHHLAHFSMFTHFGDKRWWLWLQRWLDRREEVDEKEVENLKKHLEMRFMHSDEQDIKKQHMNFVHSFLKGKSEVLVKDLKRKCDAKENLLNSILSELIENGQINVVKVDNNGKPLIIAEKDA